MDPYNSAMAQRIAQAAITFEQRRTGHAPGRVTAVLSEDTLVITLHGTLSPVERALAQSPAGAAELREFHRQLFTNSADSLRQEIERITGVRVREAAAEVAPSTGTMVQVFLLALAVPEDRCAGGDPGERSGKCGFGPGDRLEGE
ncbi:MAG TPA: DUF2294 domain-containing protein [Gemmataceae bacterium]|nr:DUF2294 domain-containing protein [Gemmataceae bacterium]